MRHGDRVAAVVLAAGLSSRMGGRFKLLLPYDEGTVVGAVVRAASAAGLDPIVVVVGHRARDVRRALEGSGARPVRNRAFRQGMGGSLAVGIRAASDERDVAACAVLLGDEPGIRPEAIRAAVEAWREAGASVLRTSYRGRAGHPVIFDRSAFPLLSRLRGDRGAADLLSDEEGWVARLELDLPAPVDVDTPSAYREAMAASGRS